jgi:hypothetical protein
VLPVCLSSLRERTLRVEGPGGVDAPDGISMPEWWCCKSPEQGSVNQVSTVGLDLAKHMFQLHGRNADDARFCGQRRFDVSLPS